MNNFRLFEQIYEISHLEEESGRQYLTYLKDKIDESPSIKDPKLSYQEINKINQNRLYDETARGDDIINNYFEGLSLKEFQNDFIDYLNSERSTMDKETRLLIIRIFNEYCKEFESGKFRHEVKFRDE